MKQDTAIACQSVMESPYTPKPFDTCLYRTVTGSEMIDNLPPYKRKSKSSFGKDTYSSLLFEEQIKQERVERMTRDEYHFSDFIFDTPLDVVSSFLVKDNQSKDSMLEVRNLHATTAGKEVLRGINLTIKDGEIHAIMGPNGSGKSAPSAVLTGNPLYEITDGMALFSGKNFLGMKPEGRSHEGPFLSFQYPVEIPGVSMANFIKAVINAKRAYEGLEPMKAAEFMALMREKRQLVSVDSTLFRRSVDKGFSGGEKKRNGVFQTAMLGPKLSTPDETDSGLDVDAICIVTEGTNKMHSGTTSAIVVTHYGRLLGVIKLGVIHMLYKGHIVKAIGSELAKEIEQRGYDRTREKADAEE